MSISKIEGKNVPIHLWTGVATVEQAALATLHNVAALPWVFHHVAVMADVHHGKGCTVGSVIAMKDAIAPAAVGVDIGCGVGAVKTNLRARDLPNNLSAWRSEIESAVPVGFAQHEQAFAAGPLFTEFKGLDDKVQGLFGKAVLQCGTLGGGNHFIEMCLDSDDNVWLMLHSGSRNIGKVLAELHIERAKKLAHNQDLPDPDLSVFLYESREMAEYVHDLYWAQRYAMLNRKTMFDLIVEAIATKFCPQIQIRHPDDIVMCHHNYVAEETHFGEKVFVTRKGAIRAGKGEMGIIPGSMGTKSFIVRGLGNPESFESASHGAGRRMSRGAAKRKFTQADLEAQTAGVECRKDVGVLDEIPGAYKDIDEVMKNQRDLVEVVTELKQILCVKG